MEKTVSSWFVWASAEMNQKLAHLRQGLHPYISLLFYSLGAGERVEEKVSRWIAVASAALERGGHLPSAGQDSCGKRRPWVWGSTLELGGRSSTSKWRSCRKVLVWAKSPVLWLRGPHWMRQRCALTFGGPRRLLPLLEDLQAHRNVQKLLIAISVPHEELLVLEDLLAALIEDLPLTLYCHQVLLRWETGTVDIGHPVPCTSFPINKVA